MPRGGHRRRRTSAALALTALLALALTALPALAAALTAAAAALAPMAAAGASPGTSAGLPRMLVNQAATRHRFQVRPTVVGFTGDGSAFLGGPEGGSTSDHFGRMTWTSWTSTVATGTGDVWIDGCEPSCAAGKYTPNAVTVRASAPRAGHFTRMTLRFDYDGEAIVEELGVKLFRASPHVQGFFEYVIVHQAASKLPAT
jgi:hypothetical protein